MRLPVDECFEFGAAVAVDAAAADILPTAAVRQFEHESGHG